MMRLLGPLPWIPLKSRPYSAAIFLANGDANTLSPEEAYEGAAAGALD
jgi:hypothetical protein